MSTSALDFPSSCVNTGPSRNESCSNRGLLTQGQVALHITIDGQKAGKIVIQPFRDAPLGSPAIPGSG